MNEKNKISSEDKFYFSVIFFIPQMIYDILCLFFHITLWVFLRLNPFVFLSVFLTLFFCLSVCPSFCLSVCFSLCMSVEHWHNCLNNGYNNQLDTDSNLGCLVIKLFWSIEENKKFDLTTLGFNDQKSPVPSGSLNRVPTVFKLWTSDSLRVGQSVDPFFHRCGCSQCPPVRLKCEID